MPREMGQLHRVTDRAADFRELLTPGAIRAVFQPIVRLSDLQPIGYEGLARFPTPPGLVAPPPPTPACGTTSRSPAGPP